MEVAQRVATELDVTIGEEVGYAFRGEKRTNDHTLIEAVTDGLLVRRLANAPLLRGVSVLVLDEVHEREEDMDLVMLLCKKLLATSSGTKLVLMSATLNEVKLKKYF